MLPRCLTCSPTAASILCLWPQCTLQSGKADQANAQAVDCIMEAANAGRRTLVLGDWNLTQEQEEGEIAAMIHSGIIHPCDAVAKGVVLPPTGPV